MHIVPVLLGVPTGAVVWWFTLRRIALREDAARRRRLGLPPRGRR